MKSIKIDSITIEKIAHDCFKIKNGVVIYFDPFNLDATQERADFILITHEHFDHCSVKDIKKIVDKNTVIISAEICRNSELNSISGEVKRIIYIKPGEKIQIEGLCVEAVPAYNVNKFRSPGLTFHPKGENRVGFLITIDDKRIYHAGDTDYIPEMGTFGKIDIALLPVSGTYVMTANEAFEAVKILKPKIVIPMHYGSIVGSLSDAKKFKEMVKSYAQVEMLD